MRQDKIDRGEMPGSSTLESAEPRAATRRIAELEAELATVKRASELFAEGRGEGRLVRPKDRCPAKHVCRILGVPFTTSCYWRNPAVSARSVRRAWLTDVICQIHSASRQTYSLRRIKADLADAYGQVVKRS